LILKVAAGLGTAKDTKDVNPITITSRNIALEAAHEALILAETGTNIHPYSGALRCEIISTCRTE